MVAYTLVVTSCGRLDLLDRTLESFVKYADIAPTVVIVTEDSGDETVRAVVRRHFSAADVIVNAERLGQMRSIDLAYAKVSTPWIFHCEDDWLFSRPGFIGQSAAVLGAMPAVSMISLRPRNEFNPLVRGLPVTAVAGVACCLWDPTLHPEYFSYSFNPGLRRTADARRLGPFAPLGGEADVSLAFKKAGFRMASLQEPAVTHIGDGRHIDDPEQPLRRKTPWHRWQNSLRKRAKRLRRWLGG